MNHSPNQLKNLEKRKRFGIDQVPPKNGGRPRHQPMSEYFREWLSDPKNRASITKRLIKLKPDVLLHYAEGKPVETQVQLTGEMAGKELEIQVARVLAAGGIQSPSPEIKTPQIES